MSALALRRTTKMLGDAGEHYAVSQLTFAGKPATKMPDGWEGYDLAVESGTGLVRVSVKTRSESQTWNANKWFTFDDRRNCEWIIFLFVPNKGKVRSWIIPFDVALRYANVPGEARKEPHFRDITWAKLTSPPLARYEDNWRLERHSESTATVAMAVELTESERSAALQLVELALVEDLASTGDLTCQALIDPHERAEVLVAARQAGMLAGSPVAHVVFQTLDAQIAWEPHVPDASPLAPGTVVAAVAGPLRSLLSGERTVLNFLTHLSGVATLTRKFVDAVAGTPARIYDTRKTLPGWRLLEKYAVRCGGGTNHRMGLYDGCLIKDNHLAAWAAARPGASIAEAIRHARERLPAGTPVEVEVDTLEQLADALSARPEIVLLDNMEPATLRDAVRLRDQTASGVQLEASGGITLANVAVVAATGVERISVGALTHSPPALDLAFDWSQRV